MKNSVTTMITTAGFKPKNSIALAVACALGLMATAHAQTPTPTTSTQKTEEVVVTGTSIRGIAAVGAPALSVDRDAISASGVSSSSEMARTIPQVINLGADESRLSGAQDGAANTTRTSGINLRGIGNEATLLLVNGRRVAASGVIKSLSDPNQIPSAAVQRLEVVLDGASAIYGSDAVAGVVNIITRKNVDAIETTLRYARADGMNQKVFSQTFGKTWDSGSTFLAYEHNDRSRLLGSARPFFSNDLRPYGGTDQRSTQASPGNIVVGPVNYALPAAQNGTGLTPAQLTSRVANRFDDGAYADFLPQQKRDSFIGNVYQNVSDRLELYYEGFYSRRTYDQHVSPVGASLSVPNTNPYYVTPLNVTPTATETVAYRFIYDDPNARFGGREKNSQNAVGLNFDLGHDWVLNGYLAYSKTDGFVYRPGQLNTILLRTGLANGGINPFSDAPGSNATFTGLYGYREQLATNTDTAVALKADGPITSIGGGEVRLAVGTDAHRVGFVQDLITTLTSANNSPTQSTIRNSRNVKALYTELFVPLVGAKNASPMVQRLELSLAARYEKYSDFGNTTNPKVGVLWAPNDVVALRSTYGTSFRAPSLVDNAAGISNIFIQNLTDPTSSTGITRGIFYNGGNAGLKPETAKTWSFGVDLKPLKGLNLSASYYKIDYKDRIDVVANTALTNESLYSSYIIRNPSAALVNTFMADPNLQNPAEPASNIKVIIDGRRSNLGTLRQQGIDLDSRYSFSNHLGDWMLGFNAAKILKLTRSGAPGQAYVDVLDTFGNPVSMRMRGSVGWKSGNWSANAFASYITDYVNTAILPNVSVSSWTTVDASVSYDFGKRPGLSPVLSGVKVTLSAQNLFDRDPPVVLNGSSSWDNSNASAIGRFVALEVSKSW